MHSNLGPSLSPFLPPSSCQPAERDLRSPAPAYLTRKLRRNQSRTLSKSAAHWPRTPRAGGCAGRCQALLSRGTRTRLQIAACASPQPPPRRCRDGLVLWFDFGAVAGLVADLVIIIIIVKVTVTMQKKVKEIDKDNGTDDKDHYSSVRRGWWWFWGWREGAGGSVGAGTQGGGGGNFINAGRVRGSCAGGYSAADLPALLTLLTSPSHRCSLRTPP